MADSLNDPNLDSLPLADLKEYFECPVCYTVPRRPPIFQCSSGHMICRLCRPKVVICPQCRSPFHGQRLLFAERLLERVPVPCNFATEGCEVELLLRDMTEHEGSCQYQRVECPHAEYGCDEEMSLRRIEGHVAKCKFAPLLCPVEDCGIRLGNKFLLTHIRNRHSQRKDDVAYLNYVVGLLFLVSFCINVLLLWT